MMEQLKKKGLKLTNQRKLILDAINQLGDDATLNNITKKTSTCVDKSTVYRMIDLFLEKDILIKKVNYQEEIYYMIKEEHGHYFTCITCHKREKIDSCPIEILENNLEKEKGYQILSHTVELNGICKDCQKANKKSI